MKSKINFLKFVLCLGDFLLMYFAILLALAIRYNDFSFLPGPRTQIFLFHFSFIHLIWLFILFLLDFYEIPSLKNLSEFFSHLIIFLFLAFLVGSVYFYVQPKIIISPKTILLMDVVFLAIFLYIWRLLISFLLKFFGFKQKILFLGSHLLLKEVLPEVLTRSEYKVLNKYEERPDLVILAFDKEDKERIKEIFSNFPLDLNYISLKDFYESLLQRVALDYIDETWFFENFKNKGKTYQFFKRLFDIVFSIIGLIVTGVLFPFVALGIKITSPGPIFYKQKRVGKNGKIFTLYKFRTMIKSAEINGPQWAVKNDSRITSFGKFLRSTHLDEFPQFFNILKGDISFVGPRPERPEFVERLKREIPFYDIRHLVKPGLTGWAQIKYKYGASVDEAKEKLKYELYYLKHRSFIFDLGIILKTIRYLF